MDEMHQLRSLQNIYLSGNYEPLDKEKITELSIKDFLISSLTSSLNALIQYDQLTFFAYRGSYNFFSKDFKPQSPLLQEKHNAYVKFFEEDAFIIQELTHTLKGDKDPILEEVAELFTATDNYLNYSKTTLSEQICAAQVSHKLSHLTRFVNTLSQEIIPLPEKTFGKIQQKILDSYEFFEVYMTPQTKLILETIVDTYLLNKSNQMTYRARNSSEQIAMSTFRQSSQLETHTKKDLALAIPENIVSFRLALSRQYGNSQ